MKKENTECGLSWEVGPHRLGAARDAAQEDLSQARPLSHGSPGGTGPGNVALKLGLSPATLAPGLTPSVPSCHGQHQQVGSTPICQGTACHPGLLDPAQLAAHTLSPL